MPKVLSGPHGHLIFCPACECGHLFDSRWTFNGDVNKPTFRASMLVNGSTPEKRCHSFVTDGKIEFCGDSAHALAGKTVELPDFDDLNKPLDDHSRILLKE